MTERLFAKSSYTTPANNCVEASAPEGYRLKGLVERCGDMACRTVSVPDELTFVSSEYSNAEGNCIEVGGVANELLLRDSKLEESPMVGVSPEAFTAFVGGLAHEEYANLNA